MTAEIRELFLNELSSIRDIITVPRADGAFYFLLRIHRDLDPMTLVKQLIEQHKVALIPGTTFGMEIGCYLRVAFGALEKDTAAEGIGRLVAGLKKIL
jgi:aspartate/methionine/tyrosine aminotransferase